MEEMLDKMSSSSVDGPEDPSYKNEYNHLFKTLSVAAGQEKRRRAILEIQRKNRNHSVDGTRGILEVVERVEQEMEVDSARAYKPSTYIPGFHKKPLTYANTLMLSEWLVEKPEDFEKRWQLVPCPKGTRVLVVAVRSSTKCYTKYGHLVKQWQTLLPGGNRGKTGSSHCCVVDCVYSEACETLYVLDFLAWGNLPMMDCESEFRHFWLQAQFHENPGLEEKSKANEVKFSLLPRLDCQKEKLDSFLSQYPAFPDDQPALDGLLFYHRQSPYLAGDNPLVGWLYPYMINEVFGEAFPDDQPALDGLLFYHRQSPYLAGDNPLVGWLYPYMINEVFGEDIKVHENYLKGKPPTYINQAAFIAAFAERTKNKKTKEKYYRKSPSHKKDKKVNSKEVNSFDPESGVSGCESMDADDGRSSPNDSCDSGKHYDSTIGEDICE